uniref:Reprolysin n=1 Tax=Rhipicephalus appendiculatus TaxID=34631 RepID=A0A131Z1P0_RHIAP
MGIARPEVVVAGALLFALLWTTSHAETLVYPRLLESRADDSDILLHVREGLTLNLRKSSIFASDFVLTTSTETGPDNVVFNGSELERDLYHDTEHRSSLVVKRKENGVEVRGILNDQLRITPAVLFERSEEGLIPHEVFTVEERSSTPKNPSEHSKNEKCVKDNTTSADRTNKSNCAEKFVVELCVVAGPTYWCAFNGTEDLVNYIATAVNVNDSIAGKNICGTTLYELRNHNSCAADILDALNSTIDLANYCELTGCDIVLQLTSGDLAMEVNSTHINRKVQGVANFGGVCTNRSAAVAEDDPLVYSGVSTMAHEIAHSVGASHDGENFTLPINGYPDALNCSWEDGYLMSASGEGRNRHRLSNCSMAQIKFLVSTLPEFRIQVHTKANYSNIFYPGQNMTPEMFCRRKHPLHEDVQPVKTCWRGVCGEHNWTDIYNTYHTYRTFEIR